MLLRLTYLEGSGKKKRLKLVFHCRLGGAPCLGCVHQTDRSMNVKLNVLLFLDRFL